MRDFFILFFLPPVAFDVAGFTPLIFLKEILTINRLLYPDPHFTVKQKAPYSDRAKTDPSLPSP
jgi:hypothetical protein